MIFVNVYNEQNPINSAPPTARNFNLNLQNNEYHKIKNPMQYAYHAAH